MDEEIVKKANERFSKFFFKIKNIFMDERACYPITLKCSFLQKKSSATI